MREAGYTGAIFGVTGNVLPSDVEHFLSKGADVVLGKPLKISELKVSGADSGREMSGADSGRKMGTPPLLSLSLCPCLAHSLTH